ncbi:nicotinamide-nucleotide amidase [Thermocrinis minervae]|uniref:Nicotinamide-nucleotide amidase n=1 Tax=Thermocrinis minervae TaxID=381751 RepID=A0A1M6T1X2_9AQUI|nr:nicotinamide-nucleotide amidase [Thermocrinis minervae]
MIVSVCSRRRKGDYVIRTFGCEDYPKDVPHRVWIGGVDFFPRNEGEKERILKSLGKYVYAESWLELEEVVARILKRRGVKLAVAESCTAGLLSARLVNVEGASSFFLGGFVVYSNDLKTKLLSVEEELLKKYGAVSEEVCRAMCISVLEETDADVSVSITGIAGPTGGTKEKPVGLTYIGIGSDREVKVWSFVFKKSRNQNRFLSTQWALFLLKEYVSNG